MAVAVMVMSLSSCGEIRKIKEIDITSAQITSIIPNGLASLNLGCKVGIDNPGIQLSLSEITCDVKHFGKVLGKVAIDPFTLEARTEQTYSLHASAQLGKDLSLMEALNLLGNSNLISELTADLHARVKLKGGLSKRVTLNDIPLKKLIDFVK